MIRFSVKADIARLGRELDGFAKGQLPFATALALNQVARQAVVAERAAMRATLDRPTSFSLRGVAYRAARKDRPVATVGILPIQARYLLPSIAGGPQVLDRSRAVLAPKNIRLDAHGNLPRGMLAALAARPDVFVGPVTFADGNTIDGVWQLPPGETKGKRSARSITGGRRRGWKLLIRFADPAALPARYHFGQATMAVVATFPAELKAALKLAMATAR